MTLQDDCKIEEESPIEAANEEHMKIEEDTPMEIVKPRMLDQLQEVMSSFDIPLMEPSIASSSLPHLGKESNCGLGVFEMDVVHTYDGNQKFRYAVNKEVWIRVTRHCKIWRGMSIMVPVLGCWRVIYSQRQPI